MALPHFGQTNWLMVPPDEQGRASLRRVSSGAKDQKDIKDPKDDKDRKVALLGALLSFMSLWSFWSLFFRSWTSTAPGTKRGGRSRPAPPKESKLLRLPSRQPARRPRRAEGLELGFQPL